MRYLFLIFISYLYLQANAHIFVYHRFADIKYPSTDTTLAELEKEFKYFKDNNYKVVPLEKILDKLEKRETIPSNWIALTIDDAFKSFYKNGLPIFKKYHYPFTLYVYVKATNKKYGDFMNWDEIKETDKYGTIALHSYSHPRLTKMSSKDIRKDTKKAINIFKTNMGYNAKTYAYPYGEYDTRVKNILREFNFRAILNQSIGTVTKRSDIYDIHRLALVGTVNIEHKLRYKTFDAIWIEPRFFPKNGVLKHIKAKVDPKIKKLKLYITGIGWQDIKVRNGIVDVTINKYLKNSRTRLMLGTDVFTISNKIIIKGTKHGK